MKSTKVVGVDIGGTKVCAGLVENGQVVKRETYNLSSNESRDFILNEVAETIKKIIDSDVEGIGVGVPGFVDSKNGIAYNLNNIKSWDKVPLKEYLENVFKIPVSVNNDANSFAVGEKVYGKGKEYSDLVGVTLGTGLGAGVVANGKLLTGVNCGAGEVAFAPYKDSIYEAYCSGQLFKNIYNTEGIEAYKKAEQGDKEALAQFEALGNHLGEYVKILLLAYAPEAIIFGGSVSKGFPFFIESLKKTVATFPFERVKKNLKIVASDMKDTAVLGAAAIFENSK